MGLLYRRDYQYSDIRSWLQLYISLVRPHLDYAAPVWDPHLQKDINSLESAQNVALKMCFKQWNIGYDGLLQYFQWKTAVFIYVDCSWFVLFPYWYCVSYYQPYTLH